MPPALCNIEEIPEPSHQSLKDLHAYWLSKKGSRIAPPRSAIQPEEITAILPTVALIDVLGDPPRFRLRLFGTGLVAAYGQDLTGKFVDKVDLGAIGAGIVAELTKIVREIRCCVVRVAFTKVLDGRHVEYERIGLPLSEDGRTVSMLLFGFAIDKAYYDH